MPTITAKPSHSSRSRRARLAFELPAVFDVVPARQGHLGLHAPLDVVHQAPQVSAGDIALDHDLTLDVLTADEVRPAILANLRHRRQGDSGSRRRVDLRLTDRVQVSNFPGIVADDERERHLAFQNLSDLLPHEGSLQGFGLRRRRQVHTWQEPADRTSPGRSGSPSAAP